MKTTYCEYNLYYYDLLIKDIVILEYKILHLALCLLWVLQTRPNNKTYYFKQ